MKKRWDKLNVFILTAVLILVAVFVGFFLGNNLSLSPRLDKSSVGSETLRADLNDDGVINTDDVGCYIFGKANVLQDGCKEIPLVLSASDFSSIFPQNEKSRTDSRADTNCDGVVSYADINPFVLALSGQQGYNQQYPNCNFMNADINCNGVVSFADINPFVQCLGGNCPPCPNPNGGICGDNAVDSKEECDGTNLGGKIYCNQSDADYISGNLGCYPADDQYGRGCTYNLEACNCNAIKAKMRIFPLDGSSLDLDKTKDGTTTQNVGTSIVFDASASCAQADYPITYYFFDDLYSEGPIYQKSYYPTALPTLYSPKLEVANDIWEGNEIQQNNAIRIISSLKNINLPFCTYLPKEHAMIGDLVFSIGSNQNCNENSNYLSEKVLGVTNISDISDSTGFVQSQILDNSNYSTVQGNFFDIATNGMSLFVMRFYYDSQGYGREIYIYNSDISNFRKVGTISSSYLSANARYLAAKNNALYVGVGDANNPQKIVVFDVGNPSNPQFVREVTTGGTDYNTWLEVKDNTLIVQVVEQGVAKILFYDITNPLNPQYRSQLPGKVAGVFNEGVSGNRVYGNILLLTLDDSLSGVRFADISDINQPVIVGSLTGSQFNNYYPMIFDDKYLIRLVPGYMSTGSYPDHLYLYNIQNLSAPYLVQELTNINEIHAKGAGFIKKGSDGKRYAYLGTHNYFGYKIYQLEPDYP